jgi:ATP-dependent Clp protease ATP-binding subunit ClpA
VDEIKQSLTDKNIKLSLTERSVNYIAEQGYDPKMGARPLSRKIDELIRVPLSKHILFDRWNNCDINIDLVDGALVFNTQSNNDTQAQVDNNGFIVVDGLGN